MKSRTAMKLKRTKEDFLYINIIILIIFLCSFLYDFFSMKDSFDSSAFNILTLGSFFFLVLFTLIFCVLKIILHFYWENDYKIYQNQRKENVMETKKEKTDFFGVFVIIAFVAALTLMALDWAGVINLLGR
jgi:hypothetical protein